MDLVDFKIKLCFFPPSRLKLRLYIKIESFLAVLAEINIIVAEKRHLSAARHIFDLDDAVRLPGLRESLPIPRHDTAKQKFLVLKLFPFAAVHILHRHVANMVQDDAVFIERMCRQIDANQFFFSVKPF